jgi:hypothetical protein
MKDLESDNQTNKTKLVVLLRQKLGLQAKISMYFGRPLLAPFIGGQVSGSWSGSIQTHQVHCYIVISLFKYTISWLLSWVIIYVGLNPNIYQGYQCHRPWQAYHVTDSVEDLNFQILPLFDF